VGNIWDEVRSAVRQSKATLQAADEVAGDLAQLLAPRLRSVDAGSWDNREALKALKKQLRDFDMTTGKWKS
jgi:hypothetical protein